MPGRKRHVELFEKCGFGSGYGCWPANLGGPSTWESQRDRSLLSGLLSVLISDLYDGELVTFADVLEQGGLTGTLEDRSEIKNGLKN